MGTVLTALFLSAGVAGLIYSQLGKRLGYSNGQQVWTLVGIGFAVTFVVVLILGGQF